ncbi:MAG: Glyoxylase, beta-lactamase superfamily II [Chloroflexi bacterium]|nr:MAG: Glyoxylase, beta-lactamase superfamily II [Chloroflexota bacterium]
MSDEAGSAPEPRQHAASAGEPVVTEIEVRGMLVGVFQENCWVIGNRRTREAICIDPGEQADDILHMADEMGVTIKLIANSHAHLDHILGVRGIQAKTGAKFLLHRDDLELSRAAVEHAKRFGMEADPVPEPDHFVEDGERVEVDGIQLQAIHTPGHTAGSMCYYNDEVLFSGDTLFRGSIGRTDLPGGSYEQEMSSIVDRLLALPDTTAVLPGHMQETTIAFERESNPFIRQELIQRAMDAGRAGAGSEPAPDASDDSEESSDDGWQERKSGLVIPE